MVTDETASTRDDEWIRISPPVYAVQLSDPVKPRWFHVRTIGIGRLIQQSAVGGWSVRCGADTRFVPDSYWVILEKASERFDEAISVVSDAVFRAEFHKLGGSL